MMKFESYEVRGPPFRFHRTKGKQSIIPQTILMKDLCHLYILFKRSKASQLMTIRENVFFLHLSVN